MTSPGRTYAQSTVEIAAMPLENTAANSPPSHRASRSSSTSRFGLLKREYTRPDVCPARGSRRPEVKSKKSFPSCAVLKANVEVRKIGGFKDPSERLGSYPYPIIWVSGLRR